MVALSLGIQYFNPRIQSKYSRDIHVNQTAQQFHTMVLDRLNPIAVIGLQCRFPGGAISPEKLWETLLAGRNTWSQVPSDRFHEQAFFHPNADDANGTNNHRGGHFLIGDVRDFDNDFFNSK